MDTLEQINIFKKIIEDQYMAELLENARLGQKYLVIDFQVLSRTDLELAELLLEDPVEVLMAASMAIEQFDLPKDPKGYSVRIKNLPKSQSVMIRDIRSKHLGKLLRIEAIVRQKSDVRPQVTTARYECPSCGNVISIIQLDSKMKQPSRCGCGRKGKFRLLSKELDDAQSIKIEEDLEDLDGGEQPKKLTVLLKNDLASPYSDKRTNPGSKVIINGILKEVPITLRTGGQSTRFDLMIEGNHVEPVEEEFGSIKLTHDDIKLIKDTSKDKDLLKNFICSIAPSIHGHDRIKEALLLQLLGGVKDINEDGDRKRGDMHILLIGDPGCGKSQFLKRINNVAPKSRFISGKGASGSGLTATVVKDDFIGGWSLEAGALPLANKGIICLDELDKMDKNDTSAMHEALEGQTVTISKANTQATLRCETTVLAAANPKYGRFDPYSKTIAEQIELPTTLINRFDLIFPVKDIADPKKDEALARFMLDRKCSTKENCEKPQYETQHLRKYIAYAKNLRPELTQEAKDKLVEYYLKMRGSGAEMDGIKSIPISPRQLEGLERLAESYAKLRLSKKGLIQDAKNAIDLMNYCLTNIAFDKETGTVDMDRISTGTKLSERASLVKVKDIIDQLEKKLGKTIPIQDITEIAKERGVTEDSVEKAIEKLKRLGDLFEPRRGFVQKI